MNWLKRLLRTALTILAANSISSSGLLADEYPKRPVTIVVPAGAGSGPDVITRLLAERLSRVWGVQAVVNNRPGGGGMIATQAMVGVEPDGHTLFMPIASTLSVMPELQPKLPLDLDRDLTPIGLVATQPMMITVHSSLGISSLPELVTLGKSRPADLLVGASRGTIPHMAWEMFRARAGIEATLVPYPSVARATQDAIAGTVNVVMESPAGLAPAVQSGTLKPLAIASATRLPNYPDVPTVSEAIPALNEFEAGGWFVLMAPAGTPSKVLAKLSADLRTVLADADLQQRFEALASYVRPLSPEETAKFIRNERELWRPIVRQVGAAQ